MTRCGRFVDKWATLVSSFAWAGLGKGWIGSPTTAAPLSLKQQQLLQKQLQQQRESADSRQEKGSAQGPSGGGTLGGHRLTATQGKKTNSGLAELRRGSH